MAKRTNVDDLLKLLDGDKPLATINAEAVIGFGVKPYEQGIWLRILTTYKTEHSAAASASIFRRKLGERARVRAVGQSVYVCYNAPEADRVAA